MLLCMDAESVLLRLTLFNKFFIMATKKVTLKLINKQTIETDESAEGQTQD